MANHTTNQQLFITIHNNDLTELQQLLQAGTDPNSRDACGRPTLVMAARAGHLALVQALIAAGADVHAVVAEQEPRLKVHTLGGPMTRSLTDMIEETTEGADTLTKGFYAGFTRLLNMLSGKPSAETVSPTETASMDDLDTDEEDEANEADKDVTTALMAAVVGGHVEVARVLINAGAPVNPPPSLQTSPLVKAAEMGHEAMVRVLLDAGADINGQWLLTPLYHAAEQGHTNIVRMLLEAGAEVDKGLTTPLNIAVGEGHTEIVRLLIAACADVNLTDSDDCLPLLEAAGNGHLDIVRLLVAAGADVNIQLQGDTPLLTAANNGHQEVFNFLAPLVHDDIRQEAECALPKGLAHKARGDRHDVEAFIEAAMMGDLQTVQAAIANGIDINAVGSNGCTALMYAAFYGHVAVVQVLIAAGANLDLQSEEDGPCPNDGMSALMQAAESAFSGHRVEVITLLAQAGANLDLQDDAGFTALMHAAGGRYQNPEPAQALLAAGAQLHLRDTEGNTALMLAKQMRHRKIAAELRRAEAV